MKCAWYNCIMSFAVVHIAYGNSPDQWSPSSSLYFMTPIKCCHIDNSCIPNLTCESKNILFAFSFLLLCHLHRFTTVNVECHFSLIQPIVIRKTCYVRKNFNRTIPGQSHDLLLQHLEQSQHPLQQLQLSQPLQQYPPVHDKESQLKTWMYVCMCVSICIHTYIYMYINSPEFIDFVHIINLACKFKKNIYKPKNQEKNSISYGKHFFTCRIYSSTHIYSYLTS